MPVKERFEKTNSGDEFQTPSHALVPLLPYLPREWNVWEPAAGKGYLVRALTDAGYSVVGSDIRRHPGCILNGEVTTPVDFLWHRLSEFDCIVTNPPYSKKDEFIARCYELGKPFALLMPLYGLESKTRQRFYHEHGLQLLVMDRRVNYETPDLKLRSCAEFVSCWFCWGLPIPRPEIPRDILFVELPKHDGPRAGLANIP